MVQIPGFNVEIKYLHELLHCFRMCTFRFRGMGSSNMKCVLSVTSSLASSPWDESRKFLLVSLDRGGDGVEGTDWSLASQLQLPLVELLQLADSTSFQTLLAGSGTAGSTHLHLIQLQAQTHLKSIKHNTFAINPTFVFSIFR